MASYLPQGKWELLAPRHTHDTPAVPRVPPSRSRPARMSTAAVPPGRPGPRRRGTGAARRTGFSQQCIAAASQPVLVPVMPHVFLLSISIYSTSHSVSRTRNGGSLQRRNEYLFRQTSKSCDKSPRNYVTAWLAVTPWRPNMRSLCAFVSSLSSIS